VISVRAIVQDAYGSADVLHVRSVSELSVADDEVLVRVVAGGVDRGAWHYRLIAIERDDCARLPRGHSMT
jgi:NADPH:quinone reductase-like Zn-dependent oxidoreductase